MSWMAYSAHRTTLVFSHFALLYCMGTVTDHYSFLFMASISLYTCRDLFNGLRTTKGLVIWEQAQLSNYCAIDETFWFYPFWDRLTTHCVCFLFRKDFFLPWRFIFLTAISLLPCSVGSQEVCDRVVFDTDCTLIVLLQNGPISSRHDVQPCSILSHLIEIHTLVLFHQINVMLCKLFISCVPSCRYRCHIY